MLFTSLSSTIASEHILERQEKDSVIGLANIELTSTIRRTENWRSLITFMSAQVIWPFLFASCLSTRCLSIVRGSRERPKNFFSKENSALRYTRDRDSKKIDHHQFAQKQSHQNRELTTIRFSVQAYVRLLQSISFVTLMNHFGETRRDGFKPFCLYYHHHHHKHHHRHHRVIPICAIAICRWFAIPTRTDLSHLIYSRFHIAFQNLSSHNG